MAKRARLRWRLLQPANAVKDSANQRMVGYSPWKRVEQVEADAALLDKEVKREHRWYSWEIQYDFENELEEDGDGDGDANPGDKAAAGAGSKSIDKSD